MTGRPSPARAANHLARRLTRERPARGREPFKIVCFLPCRRASDGRSARVRGGAKNGPHPPRADATGERFGGWRTAAPLVGSSSVAFCGEAGKPAPSCNLEEAPAIGGGRSKTSFGEFAKPVSIAARQLDSPIYIRCPSPLSPVAQASFSHNLNTPHCQSTPYRCSFVSDHKNDILKITIPAKRCHRRMWKDDRRQSLW